MGGADSPRTTDQTPEQTPPPGGDVTGGVRIDRDYGLVLESANQSVPTRDDGPNEDSKARHPDGPGGDRTRTASADHKVAATAGTAGDDKVHAGRHAAGEGKTAAHEVVSSDKTAVRSYPSPLESRHEVPMADSRAAAASGTTAVDARIPALRESIAMDLVREEAAGRHPAGQDLRRPPGAEALDSLSDRDFYHEMGLRLQVADQYLLLSAVENPYVRPAVQLTSQVSDLIRDRILLQAELRDADARRPQVRESTGVMPEPPIPGTEGMDRTHRDAYVISHLGHFQALAYMASVGRGASSVDAYRNAQRAAWVDEFVQAFPLPEAAPEQTASPDFARAADRPGERVPPVDSGHVGGSWGQGTGRRPPFYNPENRDDECVAITAALINNIEIRAIRHTAASIQASEGPVRRPREGSNHRVATPARAADYISRATGREVRSSALSEMLRTPGEYLIFLNNSHVLYGHVRDGSGIQSRGTTTIVDASIGRGWSGATASEAWTRMMGTGEAIPGTAPHSLAAAAIRSRGVTIARLLPR